MKRPIHIGISTCPNDTFAFHALIQKKVDWRGLDFEIDLLDIQELNGRAFRSELDIAKVSFHAALFLAERTLVLPSGSALGFGVGPLLLASQSQTKPTNLDQLALCPGEHTTATLLYRLFYPNTSRVEQILFSEIMPRLKSKQADFGVCIHEGRFTWQEEGLFLVEDLGTRWEAETHSPLPLGGIIGDRSLGLDTLHTVHGVIRDSLEYGLAHREETYPTMRRYAQEFSDSVLMQHVELYVNEWTIDLGQVGQAALDELSRRAQQIGLIAEEAAQLKIL